MCLASCHLETPPKAFGQMTVTAVAVPLINSGIAEFLVKAITQTVRETGRFSVSKKLNLTQTLI